MSLGHYILVTWTYTCHLDIIVDWIESCALAWIRRITYRASGAPLHGVLAGSVELTALVVDRCVGVTGETLLALCTSCPNLKRLSMSGLGHVTVEAAWAMVTQGCLSELNVLRSGDLFAELGRLLQGSEEKDVRTRLFDHEIAQLKDLRLTP